MQTLLDTNCLLRYLLDDIPEQAHMVAQAVEDGACTSPVFISEAVYVLAGRVYGFERSEVANALITLLDDIDCEHAPAMRRALVLFANTSLDFPDCVLAARHEVEAQPIMTFDKKLQQLISTTDIRESTSHASE